MDSHNNKRLIIGIMLDKYVLPAWEYKIIEKLSGSDFADITLVIRINSKVGSGESEKATGTFFMRLQEKIDRAIFRVKPDYKRGKDSSGLLSSIPVLDHLSAERVSGDRSNDINKIKTFNLDVILKFGYTDPEADILKIPLYGVWSFSMNDLRFNGITTGFSEVVNKSVVTRSVLYVLDGSTGKKEPLFTASEATCFYSVNITRNRLFWRSSYFVPRIIKALYLHRDQHLTHMKERFKDEPLTGSTDLSNNLLARHALRNLLKFFAVLAKQVLKKLRYSDDFNWKLLYKIDTGRQFSTSFGAFKELRPAGNRFWADPFVVNRNDRYYIFVEEFYYKNQRGHISVLELDEKGNLEKSTKIIEKPYHMSYPFIFELNNAFYMIPETCQNRSIDLYRCTLFPDKWEFVKSLMKDVSAVDTTLFYYKDKWWLFTSVDETNGISGGSTELFLFFSDDVLSGEWLAHPQNPIVSDVRNARPAGNLFIHEGKIYRPSQDCTERYGKCWNLNIITKLNETEYDEVLISKTEPVWDSHLKGTHTFNFDRNLTVIDVYSFRKRLFH